MTYDDANDQGIWYQSARTYQLLWHCQLPYSIHGVCWIREPDVNDDDDDNVNKDHSSLLLITTRRSVHIFKSQIVPTRDYKTQAAMIQTKIHTLIAQQEEDQTARPATMDHNTNNSNTVVPDATTITTATTTTTTTTTTSTPTIENL
jgi:hypothetical protein